ncbi:hypothetical protein [Actinopolymorpha pittospori]
MDSVCGYLHIDNPEAKGAIGTAYEVARDYTAPFIVRAVDDMLTDIRVDLDRDPTERVVFVGRDGNSLAIAARQLNPDLIESHSSYVVLSRAVVDAAIQDLEQGANKSFPELGDFRRAAGKVDPTTIEGAKQRLTEYLLMAGVPAGRPGAAITLVDTSYKGTVQELLSAVYPESNFQGRYVFYGASPMDPHPGTKKGYALNLEADRSGGGRPLNQLPGDPSLTLAHQDAIGAVEETLHGPYTSPRRIDGDGPQQSWQRDEPEPLDGLNPLRVAEPYKDPTTREAVKAVNLLAVADYAAHIARDRAAGNDTSSELRDGATAYTTQVRAWIAGEECDPRFAEVMDSFVRRSDKAHVDALGRAIKRSGHADDAEPIWTAYDELDSLDQRATFVANFEREHLEGGKD